MPGISAVGSHFQGLFWGLSVFLSLIGNISSQPSNDHLRTQIDPLPVPLKYIVIRESQTVVEEAVDGAKVQRASSSRRVVAKIRFLMSMWWRSQCNTVMVPVWFKWIFVIGCARLLCLLSSDESENKVSQIITFHKTQTVCSLNCQNNSFCKIFIFLWAVPAPTGQRTQWLSVLLSTPPHIQLWPTLHTSHQSLCLYTGGDISAYLPLHLCTDPPQTHTQTQTHTNSATEKTSKGPGVADGGGPQITNPVSVSM